MRHISYCSQSAGMAKAEFNDLVKHAIGKNQDLGVRGAIAWDGGLIAHIIEGTANIVDDLYCRIRADRRHTGVVLLARADITTSQFYDFGLTKRSPFDLYMMSLAITEQRGWGNSSTEGFEHFPIPLSEPDALTLETAR